jgi:DNA repair protein RecO (recombination protein O)
MAALQPLSQVEFLCHFREDRDLQSGSDIKLREVYSSLNSDPVKSSIAFFIDEILYRSIGDDCDEGLYEFVDSSLALLDNMEDPSNFHLSFIFRLTRFLGFYPGREGAQGAVCFDLMEGAYRHKLPDHDHYITGKLLSKFVDFLETPIADCNRIKMSRSNRNELLAQGVDYYKLHRPGVKEIHSLPVLQSIFTDY